MRKVAVVGLLAALALSSHLALTAAEPAHSWHRDGKGGWGLFSGDTQVGYLDAAGRYYPRPAPGVWGEQTDPPIPVPAGAPIFGVSADRLAAPAGKVRYSLNGREVTEVDAHRALDAAGAPKDLPDPRGKIALTVIGSPADRAPVMKDLATHPALTPFKDRLAVREYDPAHWHLDPGFVRDGKPTIYLQTDTGVVLHRQDDYRGPDALAAAVRKADPSYDRKKDPDLNRAFPILDGLAVLAFLSRVPPAVWVLGALGLYLILTRKKD